MSAISHHRNGPARGRFVLWITVRTKKSPSRATNKVETFARKERFTRDEWTELYLVVSYGTQPDTPLVRERDEHRKKNIL
jgi:hypothetical protein